MRPEVLRKRGVFNLSPRRIPLVEIEVTRQEWLRLLEVLDLGLELARRVLRGEDGKEVAEKIYHESP